MALIKGITVTLVDKVQTGTDEFNHTIYEDKEVDIENVLISPLSDTEILDTLNLTGKKAVYQLAIPKTDNHNWEGKKVRFFGEEWRVIGKPTRGIESMIPLEWNMKVKVESIV